MGPKISVWILPYIIVFALLAYSCVPTAGTQKTKVTEIPTIEEPAPLVEPEPEVIISKGPTKREIMIEEVIEVWQMFFDDQGASPDDSRRERFPEFAENVVDAVLYYQENPTDIGGQLPKDGKAHIMVATMITLESSVRANITSKSKLKEVGLMQIHGEALNGIARSAVINNPKLGVMLGVRWLAHNIYVCKYPTDKWKDWHWARSLSFYGAGAPKGLKNGKCRSLRFGTRRIRLTNFYKARLDASKNS